MLLFTQYLNRCCSDTQEHDSRVSSSLFAKQNFYAGCSDAIHRGYVNGDNSINMGEVQVFVDCFSIKGFAVFCRACT